MLCKNSSSKIIGEIDIINDKLIVNHYQKPQLIIEDKTLIQNIKNNNHEYIKVLYDDYGLSISEIAPLFNLNYSNTNKILLSLHPKTGAKEGRRNATYGTKFSEETLIKLRKSHKGQIPVGYERTTEIREKISKTLKEKYASGEIYNDPQKFSNAWARGCYKDATFGTGIQGYFFSIKNEKDIYFRSLLELNYLLEFEKSPEIINYQMEPFQIQLTEKAHYTPDVLINNKYLIEIKPEKHLNYTSADRFQQEIEGANRYCNEHNLIFKVLYDKDIGFVTSKFKSFLRNNLNIVEQFNIRFNRGTEDALKADWQK